MKAFHFSELTCPVRDWNLLSNSIEDVLDNFLLTRNLNCWCQQDRALAHSVIALCDFLCYCISLKWIDTLTAMAWLVRFLNYFLLHFHLCQNEWERCIRGYVENLPSVLETYSKLLLKYNDMKNVLSPHVPFNLSQDFLKLKVLTVSISWFFL